MSGDGVLAEALEVLEIAEVESALTRAATPFTEAELGYARSKSDPERRLAARLAAKRAAARLLGSGLSLAEIEVLPGRGGPPRLRLSEAGGRLLAARGAERILVSLTHGRTHAAALVVLVAGGGE